MAHSPLKVGDKAPAFELATDGGKAVRLADLKGSKVVLYFYPKADTPGCTKEAIAFNGLKKAFESAGTRIVGVSADPVKALDKFKSKYDLGFELASNERRDMLEAYGVWVEKSLYGRKYMGIERATFLIDASGAIARIWPKVKVDGHAEEVLAAAQAL